MISALTYTVIFLSVALSHRYKLISSLIFSTTFGLAYQIGHADYISYVTLYESLMEEERSTGLTMAALTGHYEPIYIILAMLSASSGIEFYFFRFLLYTFSYYAFLTALRNTLIIDKKTFIIIFLALTSFTHIFSVDRQAISLLLILPALYSASLILKYLPIGFHFSSLSIIVPLLLTNLKKTTIFIVVAIGGGLYAYSDKYLYLIDDIKISSLSITNLTILFSLFVVYLSSIRTKKVKDKRISTLLLFCIAIGCATVVWPAIFYRLKAIFLMIILIFFFSRSRKSRIGSNVRFFIATLLTYAISIFYVLGDPLAFDPYQNLLLKNYLNYQDKTNLWWEIFRD
jgi:hypothetical protein